MGVGTGHAGTRSLSYPLRTMQGMGTERVADLVGGQAEASGQDALRARVVEVMARLVAGDRDATWDLHVLAEVPVRHILRARRAPATARRRSRWPPKAASGPTPSARSASASGSASPRWPDQVGMDHAGEDAARASPSRLAVS
jgi:hypothetical protein